MTPTPPPISRRPASSRPAGEFFTPVTVPGSSHRTDPLIPTATTGTAPDNSRDARRDAMLEEVPDVYRVNPLRLMVIHRLGLAARRLSSIISRPDQVDSQRRPGPHALVFLHHHAPVLLPTPGWHPTTPAGRPGAGHDEIRITHRSFQHHPDDLDDPEDTNAPDVTDLNYLLTTLHQRAEEFLRAKVRDLIEVLTDGGDPIDPFTHRYYGLATISIHRPGTAGGNRDSSPNPGPRGDSGGSRTARLQWLGWTGHIHLIDGTRITLRATEGLDPPTVRTSHTLLLRDPDPDGIDTTPVNPGLHWTLDTDTHDPIEIPLHTLHELVERAENARYQRAQLANPYHRSHRPEPGRPDPGRPEPDRPDPTSRGRS